MQESLYNTVQKMQSERKVNVEELEQVLNSDIEEVVSLCKKACLKPKTDNNGNAYFTSEDVNILKKMKELFDQTQTLNQKVNIDKEIFEEENSLTSPNKKINFLTKAKNRIKTQSIMPVSENYTTNMQIQGSLAKLENNLVDKFSALLSEKMDGFDEIIVELIRSKTENENLRAQVNTLNKQIFSMKKEIASYVPLPFGLYTKRDIEDL